MKPVLFEFDALGLKKQNDYIFQYVINRRLTDVYHAHDFYEILWFLQGETTQTVNGLPKRYQKGDVLILRPGDAHCFSEQSRDVCLVSLSVKKEEFERLASLYDPLLLAVFLRGNTPIDYACGLSCESEPSFARLALGGTVYDCKFLLCALLRVYLESGACDSATAQLPVPLAAAIKKMTRPENLKRGIPAWIELTHYSQSHLARMLKKHFGLGVKQYINELRLQAAYEEIVFSPKPFAEISEEIGFASLSHFNKIFKARFAITPAALRKNRGYWTT